MAGREDRSHKAARIEGMANYGDFGRHRRTSRPIYARSFRWTETYSFQKNASAVRLFFLGKGTSESTPV